ncbi:uncharacterized protein LOC100122554 [Nasonia vitripennis]|uniref:Uncharacterized protein n=1 Tax=Nasonia vitripennis TaxID=7425 RepID=A0A7M7ITD6_NASVI|nr:uncharacterized protein LOC100122554 [Nasonia vitripennis]
MRSIVFLLFSTCLVLISADRNLETEILQRCKYVTCNDVNDLSKEAHIRNCIKTTCGSRYLKGSLSKFCSDSCIEEVSKRHQNPKPDDDGKLPTVLDYSWMD